MKSHPEEPTEHDSTTNRLACRAPIPHPLLKNAEPMSSKDALMRAGKAIPRRAFLCRGIAATGVLAVPTLLDRGVWSSDANTVPSERVGVGLIGRGAMGSGHLRRLAGDPSFQLLGVCDVDQVRRDAGKNTAEDIYATEKARGTYRGCTAYVDYRELLARKEIDAVVVATPDHWHTFQAIDAMKAGKDVYCEKPISLTIEEGQRTVQVARRYGRIYQTGTQYRSIPSIRRVCQFVREGGLGKVKSAFALWHDLSGWISSDRCRPYASVLNPSVCGKSYVPLDFALPEEPVPEGLDWDLWVGPAPWRPFNPLYHANPSPGVVPWAFADAFGVTSLTWHLAHSADVIQYALGVERSGPIEVIHPSSGEFPTLTCRYAGGTLLHLVDHWGMVTDLYHAVPADARLAGNFGGLFVGERGWVTSMSTGGPVEAGPNSLLEEIQLKSREVNIGANDHHANWLSGIRTRRAPSSDEEIGHRSASLGHLANIACWTGRSLKWDPAKEEFLEDDMANRMRSRAARAPWRL